MKNLYKITLLLCALCALSCEGDTEATAVSGSDQAVSFSGSLTSRATDTAFVSGDKISVTAYDASGAIFERNVSYSYANSLFESDTPVEHESKGQELSYRALYPYVEMSDSKVVNFSVKTDQSSGANFTLSDLSASYVAATSSTSPVLSFDHLLTKVVVNVSSVEVDMVNVVATLEASTTVEYNIGTLMAVTEDSPETITMVSNGVNSYKAIIAPQELLSEDQFGTISVNGKEYTFCFADDEDVAVGTTISLKAGKEYTYEMEIVNGEIKFTSPVISNWGEGEYK